MLVQSTFALPMAKCILHVDFFPVVLIGVMAYNVAISDDILIVLERTSKLTQFLNYFNLPMHCSFGVLSRPIMQVGKHLCIKLNAFKCK